MPTVRAYAAAAPKSPLAPLDIPRREPGPKDVVIDIKYCGVCHSDIHQARDEWGGGRFPMVPGHEIVGIVRAVGAKARRFKAGDHAGVGCLVDSCRECANCRKGLEQHCFGPASFTYNSVERDGRTPTYGGYSKSVVVNEDFVLKLDKKLPLAEAAPLLCAGITTWSPLKRFGVRKGSKVGVLGLGGLGHMAVKLAAALGAEVTVLSGSPSKKPDAKGLGAARFLLTSDAGAMAAAAASLDLIVDTVSGPHDLNAALGLLGTGGTLVMVGASPEPLPVGTFPLILMRRAIAGSLIGGIAETQRMLDFCAKKKVVSTVEVLPVQKVNEAFDRVASGAVRYRAVLDLSTL
jgi:alcohol dehydrogenase (NADP+)